VEFSDYEGDDFITDAWDPSHSTISDGADKSFALPTNGMKFIEIYGAGGDLLAVSTFVSGSTCTMLAHSSSNFTPVFQGDAATAAKAAKSSNQTRDGIR
jgi:hypothetical protein